MENISQTILKDLRVLEVGEGTAVGWCGRMLLDFGAQVFRLKNKSIKKLEDEGVCVENAHTNKNLKEWLNYKKEELENIQYSTANIATLIQPTEQYITYSRNNLPQG